MRNTEPSFTQKLIEYTFFFNPNTENFWSYSCSPCVDMDKAIALTHDEIPFGSIGECREGFDIPFEYKTVTIQVLVTITKSSIIEKLQQL